MGREASLASYRRGGILKGLNVGDPGLEEFLSKTADARQKFQCCPYLGDGVPGGSWGLVTTEN